MEIIEIDGSQGEGGGQVLRTTLSLSACTGKAVHICHIRSGRNKPGLMRQHLACVNAAAAISGACVKGASIGSKNVQFIPGSINSGEYHFSVGSAGSSTLIFQTLLPILMMAKSDTRLVLEGGTHNPMAPTYDFIREAFIPLMKLIGVACHAQIKRYGFYPLGGGHWTVHIEPPKIFHRIDLKHRSKLLKTEAFCIGCGLPSHVTEREMKRLQSKLNWPQEQIKCHQVKSLGAGNVVSLRSHYSHGCEVIDSIGQIGINAERVANIALEKLRRYQGFGAPIGEHLADQLLVPMAIAEGGSFITGPLSNHTRTNIAVIKQLLDIEINCEELAPNRKWLISLRKPM